MSTIAFIILAYNDFVILISKNKEKILHNDIFVKMYCLIPNYLPWNRGIWRFKGGKNWRGFVLDVFSITSSMSPFSFNMFLLNKIILKMTFNIDPKFTPNHLFLSKFWIFVKWTNFSKNVDQVWKQQY
jgi:hypothetical protein